MPDTPDLEESTRPDKSDCGDRIALLWLLGATIVLRVAVLLVFRQGLSTDPDAYVDLARRWTEQGEFAVLLEQPQMVQGEWQPPGNASRPTAYRPPLYPLLLSLLLRSGLPIEVLVGLLHVACGVGTVWLTFRIARRWLSRSGALFAGVLVAVDPILLFQQTEPMTETLATLLGMWAMERALAARRENRGIAWWWCGLLLGLAILCRPPFLIWAILIVAFAAVASRRQCSLPTRLFRAGLVGLAIACLLAPWMIRNARVLGTAKATTTHGGYTLLLANNDSFYDAMRRGDDLSRWQAESDEFQAELRRAWSRRVGESQQELLRDQAYYDAALSVIRRRPRDFAESCIRRLLWFWTPLPAARSHPSRLLELLRWGTAGFYSVELALAFLGVWAIGRAAQGSGNGSRNFLALWLGLAISLSLIHTVYWSNLRMRAPLMPGIACLAVLGWKHGASRLRSKCSD